MRMKAITYERYGSPDVLHVNTVERPVPGVDEVLIRVHAAEATKADCELRSFRFPVQWFWLPLRLAHGVLRPRRRILGGYFAGVIEALGRDVSAFRAGDEVFGCAGLRLGAYAEFATLPASYTIVTKPRNMSFEEAAAVPLGGLNALHFMNRAGIAPGESVLVNGAGGSIGAHAVQIAKLMGAEVTAVDSGIKEAMLRNLGADHFVDYTRGHFLDSGRRFDVVFDMVAKSSYGSCIRALNPGGRYLKGNPRLSDILRATFTNRFTDKKVVVALARETVAELETLRSLIEAGEIRPIVDRVMPMESAAEAHRLVEAEERRGAIVIALNAGGRSE